MRPIHLKIPGSPVSYMTVDPFTGEEVTNTLTHVTLYDGSEDLWVARIDAETGEVEMFPDPPEQ